MISTDVHKLCEFPVSHLWTQRKPSVGRKMRPDVSTSFHRMRVVMHRIVGGSVDSFASAPVAGETMVSDRFCTFSQTLLCTNGGSCDEFNQIEQEIPVVGFTSERTFAGRRFATKKGAMKHVRVTPARIAELLAMPYSEYLRTPEWRATRRRMLRWASGKCERCGSDLHLDVHHKTYERLGNESTGDLLVLCRGCHAAEHGRSSSGSAVRP